MCLVPGINEISTAFSQRPENTVKVMRRCRDDEPYQGSGVYDTDDDGNIIDVAEDGRDVAVYYTYNGTAGTEPEGSVFFYETETTDSSGKRIVTASGTSFKETAVTAEQFDASTQSYFVLEDPSLYVAWPDDAGGKDKSPQSVVLQGFAGVSAAKRRIVFHVIPPCRGMVVAYSCRYC